MKKLILLSIIVITVSARLFSQERIALIEQFSNSSCAPCGAVSPYIYDFADNNPLKTIAV